MPERDEETDSTLPATPDTLPGTPVPSTTRESELPVVDALHYTNRKTLSRGGMGRIVTAFDRRLSRVVAIKELREQNDELGARFEREIQLTAQLEHPSIVTVHEAGRWPSGEPFYAMRLVPGRALDRRLAEATELPARLAYLPNVIAVADALAYAHGRHVIHRDLKPGNVMVGDYGETVVIDWGLAKELDRNRSSRSTITGADSAPGLTELGDVLGTPAYMPVEQAQGGKVDERVDVYAIGAILYHVIAGRPPYEGETKEVLAQLLAEPPPPLEAAAPSVPPDLLAIARRAMARKAADRYPTARELADDLRKYQAGQLVGAHQYSLRELLRRWISRNRVVLSISAVALLVLVAIAAYSVARIVEAEHVAQDERRLAERQRAAAEEQRGEVEELLNFMLFDLRDKLRDIDRLDLLAEVATRANDYYAHHPEVRDDADRRRRIAALNNIGEVLEARGNSTAALAAFRAAVAMAHEPTGELVGAISGVGDVLVAQGKSDDALAQFRQALATAEKLPATPEHQAILAMLHERVGDVLHVRGDEDGALAEYRRDIEIVQPLAAGNDPALRRDLAVARERVGKALLASGKLDEAMAEFRQVAATMDDLASKAPREPLRLRDAATAHEHLGDILLATTQVKEALDEYRFDVAATERAGAIDPGDATVLRELTIARNKVGNALLALKDYKAALTEYRASLVIAQGLAERDRENFDWQRQLAVAHLKVGDAALMLGDGQTALAEYRAALPIHEALVAKDRQRPEWRRDLYVIHDSIGDALHVLGDHRGAIENIQRAIDEAKAVAAEFPGNEKTTDDLATLREDLVKAGGTP